MRMKTVFVYSCLFLLSGVGMVCSAEEPGRDTIVLSPKGGGSSVQIVVPRGFGIWNLNFPENMLLDGPGRGTAAMTWRTQEDGTIVVEGRMEGEYAHSIRITYTPVRETVNITLEVVNLSGKTWEYGGSVSFDYCDLWFTACPAPSQCFPGRERM